MKIILLVLFVAVFLSACYKKRQVAELLEALPNRMRHRNPQQFITYTIRKGQHFCDQNLVQPVEGTEMRFTALFDASARYTLPVSDYDHSADVNKLYGFTEGSMNHQHSARIGWRWYNGGLQLLAYVYINGQLLRDANYDPPLIATVPIGVPIECSIQVNGPTYVFTVGDQTVTTPRGPQTPGFKGYQQFPFFGGDYRAPQDITILIK